MVFLVCVIYVVVFMVLFLLLSMMIFARSVSASSRNRRVSRAFFLFFGFGYDCEFRCIKLFLMVDNFLFSVLLSVL